MDKETKEFDLMGEQRGGAAGEYGKLCPVWERERALHQYTGLIFVLGGIQYKKEASILV